MVSIPKVLSNKTVFTGLVQSGQKSASLFKPAPGAVDKMGKILGPAAPTAKLGKKSASGFSVDLSVAVKSGMGQPGFVPKHTVRFR